MPFFVPGDPARPFEIGPWLDFGLWLLGALVVLRLWYGLRRLNWLRPRLRQLTLAGGLVGFVLGGVMSAVLLTGPVATHIFHGLQLLVGEADWTNAALASSNSGQAALVHLARLSAPFATLSLVLYLFRDAHAWLLTMSRPRVGHTVLCGLGKAGRIFLEQWEREGFPDGGLTVVEADADNAAVESARSRGISVVVGDARDESVLEKARVADADALVCLLPDDRLNIELALEARRHAEAKHSSFQQSTSSQYVEAVRPNRPALRIIVHVDNSWLTGRVQYHDRFGPESVTQTRFANLYEASARRAIRDFGPDIYADALDSPKVHISIYGFGQMGQAIFEQVCVQCQYLGSKGSARDFPRFTIYDRNRDACEEALRRRWPELVERVNLRTVSLNTADAGIQSRDIAAAVENGAAPPTQHFVCFDSDEKSISCAVSLRDELRNMASINGCAWNAPVMVRMSSQDGLAQALFRLEPADGDKQRQSEAFPDNLHPFGMIDEVLAPGSLIGDRRDRVAQLLHDESYREQRQADARQPTSAWRKESDVPWEHLSLFFKRSNRSQADHIDAKLRMVRCVSTVTGVREVDDSSNWWWRQASSEAGLNLNHPLCDKESFLGQNMRGQKGRSRLDALARMEKSRWNAFYRANGWRWGEHRVDQAKVHDNLVSWNDERLSDHARAYDARHVADIPSILSAVRHPAKGQSTVARSLMIGVTGHRPGRLLNPAPSEPTGLRAYLDRFASLWDHVEAECSRIVELIPEEAGDSPIQVTLVSALAEGADRLLVKLLRRQLMAQGIEARILVTLPLPFDIYYVDFGELDALPDDPAFPRKLEEARDGRHLGGPNRNRRLLADRGLETALASGSLASGADDEGWDTERYCSPLAPFDVWTSIREFQSFIGPNTRILEMPMRFGTLSELGWKWAPAARESHSYVADETIYESNPERNRQYALTNAYLAQRCDMLVALWDGSAAQRDVNEKASDEPLQRQLESRRLRVGGTDQLVDWWLAPDRIPNDLLWCHLYHEPPPQPRPLFCLSNNAGIS